MRFTKRTGAAKDTLSRAADDIVGFGDATGGETI
jgi:hypothetical protein